MIQNQVPETGREKLAERSRLASHGVTTITIQTGSASTFLSFRDAAMYCSFLDQFPKFFAEGFSDR
jgi:hypothetical protein